MKNLFCLLLLAASLCSAQDISIEGRGFTQPATAGSAVLPGQILKIDSNARFIPVTTSDTGGAFSIAQTGASQTGSSFRMAIYGNWPVLVDGSCSIGQILSISSTVGGSAHCSSGPIGQQIATALQAISGAGTIQANLNFSGTGSPTFGPVSASSLNGVINAAKEAGADIGAQVNAAQVDPLCPSTGCEIHIPVGTGNYNFATPVVFSKTILLICDGIGGMANGALRQTTTLTWTGGASAMVTISGAAVTASKFKGCALNNTGSATVGVDLDNSANDVQLENISAVIPTVPFSNSAFRVGNTGSVVNPQFIHTVARAAAPIGYNIINVGSHMEGIQLRANQNTVADMVLGTASSSVQSFNCYSCLIERATGASVETGVSFVRVEGVHFIGGYSEGGGSATVYPFDCASTATLCRNITIDSMYLSCNNATCANAPVHSNLSSATINVSNSYLVGWNSGNAVLWNEAVEQANLFGNRLRFVGAVVSNSFTNVNQCGNEPNSGAAFACNWTAAVTFAGTIQNGSTLVGSLPSAASNPFAQIGVTDSTAVAAEGQTCVGSSTNKAIAISNGTVWKCF